MKAKVYIESSVISYCASRTSQNLNEEAHQLTQGLLSTRLLPMNSVDDALHIAIASAHGMDYLLTWNFKHINNAETKNRIRAFIEESGFVCPVLCSPEELGGLFND